MACEGRQNHRKAITACSAGWSYPTFSGEADGFGNYNNQVFQAFDQYQSGTVKKVAIQYRALPVPVVDLRVPPGQYNDSIFDGVDKLIARMNAEEQDCPDTKFVVLGYSQGALSAHIALRILANNDAQMASKIAGVAFVADPGRISGGAEEWWRSAELVNDQLTVYTPGVLETLSSGVWSAPNLFQSNSANGPLPASIADRTVALCHNRDLVCAAFLGAGIGPHTNYSSSELEALGYMLAQKVPG